MKLNVKMESPAIVIPESATSPNGLVVELGTLAVQNGFQTVWTKGRVVLSKMQNDKSNLLFFSYK